MIGVAGIGAEAAWVVANMLGASPRPGRCERSEDRALAPGAPSIVTTCSGEVGAVFGLDISRLAGSSAEIQRLLEYCALTNTLVIDSDSIYAPRDFDYQLVLGIKGRLAQAELHVMGARLQGATRPCAASCAARCRPACSTTPMPTDHRPDEGVQAAISDVFKAFAQTGSAYGVRRGRRL